MKNTLNNIAKWLYKKTKPDMPEKWDSMFYGHRILVSKFMPPNTIMFGHKDYKSLSDFFLDKEIIK